LRLVAGLADGCNVFGNPAAVSASLKSSTSTATPNSGHIKRLKTS
jgi:hypothetical protein